MLLLNLLTLFKRFLETLLLFLGKSEIKNKKFKFKTNQLLIFLGLGSYTIKN